MLEAKDVAIEDSVRFRELAKLTDMDVALYCYCAVFDLPYKQIDADNWLDYVKKINQAANGQKLDFRDGDYDIKKLIDTKLSDKERWQNVWGAGYKTEDYKRLDSIFDTYSSRLVKSGGMDEQQEDTLRVCCKMRLKADNALQKGDKESVDIAAKLNKMIQDNLSAENLRKKDNKVEESVRIDTIVESLEKAGLVKAGKILPLPDLQEQLLRRLGTLGGKPSHRYPYTMDAADQMIMMIANTMYANDGLPELTELPDNMRFDANVACEFADDPNMDEEHTYEMLGIRRMDGKQNSGGGNNGRN